MSRRRGGRRTASCLVRLIGLLWLTIVALYARLLFKVHQDSSIQVVDHMAALLQESTESLLLSNNHNTSSAAASYDTDERQSLHHSWAFPPDPTSLANTPPGSPFAYAFLLVGCNPDDPTYTGFLLNILIALRILREQGSTADFVVLVRLSPKATSQDPTRRLPPHHEAWLQALQARVWYLHPPAATESFDESQLLKFVVTDLYQYQRVLYLDADAMPVCNLDYLFQLSTTTTTIDEQNRTADQPFLQPNVVVAWTREPANGGFFLLQPEKGAYQAILDIYAAQQRRDAHLPDPPHFNVTAGWGHVIAPPDHWHALSKFRKRGDLWDFYAAYSDQGLLYHWVKYVKKCVTIIVGGTQVEHWGTSPNGTLQLLQTTDHSFLQPYSCVPLVGRKEKQKYVFAAQPASGLHFMGQPPYSDFVHFYGKFKPWALVDVEGQPTKMEAPIEERSQATSARQYWFFELRKLCDELDGMKEHVDLEHWNDYAATFQGAPLPGSEVIELVSTDEIVKRYNRWKAKRDREKRKQGIS